jgi:heme exporter protein A
MRLCASNLGLTRGTTVLFTGLTFAVNAGEALVVVGPNGAGKSSLLRAIAGLLRPSSGTIELEGGIPEMSVAEHAHYLGHQDAFKPSLTVAENLDFWRLFLGPGEGLLPGEALEEVGLDALADLPAGYLSAGQRRRLSLARLLAVKRPIWLLDEPTSSLDAASQDRLAALMAQHLEEGLIVAASHGPLLAGARELRIATRPRPALPEPPAEASNG